jgi:glucose-6-phosphate-specific signal transduction histidine kinase
MGTKKAIVIVTTLGLLFIGFIFRAIEKRQRKRILERKQSISRDYKSGIDAVAEEVAHDIHNQVEHEIDTINHQASIAYHDETSQS